MAELHIDGWFIISLTLAVLIAAAVTAYYNGAFDKLYVQMCEKYFKAKAKTEMLGLQAKGQKEGVDFVKAGELDGSKQAARMQERMKDLDSGLNGAAGKEGVVGKGLDGVSGITGKVGLL
ncbi:hypothetical protein FGG08_003976 [Glutinoglossum americanum]|uniref:Uncharacterized protein n=1 Tax=Glutinoglossum americanum TaxID=1670608 RepID=A0A9P8I681_9PEZI|nr:hypothetical protein FGG08_003976 [Glutinoglossum americanum]